MKYKKFGSIGEYYNHKNIDFPETPPGARELKGIRPQSSSRGIIPNYPHQQSFTDYTQSGLMPRLLAVELGARSQLKLPLAVEPVRNEIPSYPQERPRPSSQTKIKYLPYSQQPNSPKIIVAPKQLSLPISHKCNHSNYIMVILCLVLIIVFLLTKLIDKKNQ